VRKSRSVATSKNLIPQELQPERDRSAVLVPIYHYSPVDEDQMLHQPLHCRASVVFHAFKDLRVGIAVEPLVSRLYWY
jgi:hypothetical protein